MASAARRTAAGRGSVLLVAGVLLVVAAWLLGPGLWGGRVLASDALAWASPPFNVHAPPHLGPANPDQFDAVFLFHPHLLAFRDALRHGTFLSWNPQIDAGRPLGAEQGGPLFPLSWPAFLLPFWSSLAWIALAKLLIAGLGAYVLARALGLRPLAAALAAVSFPFGLFFVVFLDHGQTSNAALLPWVFVLVDRVCRERSLLAAVGLGALGGASAYSGHPETILIAALAVLAWAVLCVVELVRADAGRTAVRRAGGLLLGAGVLALLIAGLFVVPFAELLGQARNTVRAVATAPRHVLIQGSFFPEYWGRPDKVVAAKPGDTIFAGRAYYIGAAPLMLAVGGLVARRGRRQLFFAGLGALAGLIALRPPGTEAVVRHVAPFSQTNSQHYLLVTVFCGSILAAYGANVLLSGTGRQRSLLLAGAGLVALAPVVAFAPHHLGSLGRALRNLPVVHDDERSGAVIALASQARWVILALVVLAAVAAARWRPRVAAALVAGLVALTAIDLQTLDHGYTPLVAHRDVGLTTPPSLALIRSGGPGTRFAAPTPVVAANLAERVGLDDARGVDLPELRRFGDTYEALSGRIDPGFGSTLLGTADDPATRRIVEAFSVRYLVDTGQPGRVPPGYRRILSRPGERVLAVSGTLPRAWVACRWRVADSERAAVRLVGASTTGQLLQAPVIERSSDASPTPRPCPGAVAASITHEHPTELSIAADSSAGGLLVITNTYYPGWRATVDGRATPTVRPANGAFQAVPVGAGHHRIRLAYRSGAVRAGAVLSALGILAGLAALVAALLLRRRGGSRRPGEDSNLRPSD